ncbi:hypothetical protein JOF56_010771 [Kibdelosporangium banguiense]|uniref:HNH nuclease domain-containing protein n=1 Tax=Kibdelosporangium banguiense TaxID=1365924 RepID=A0ABS4U2E9_9PSEU|nr:hypothetical protein [Kibdelosporangium banguiense]MBP2330386.1 hypothetical protein [Kibdelosporangium banguiense]
MTKKPAPVVVKGRRKPLALPLPPSNSAMSAALKASAKPTLDRLRPAGQDMVGNGAVAAAAESGPAVAKRSPETDPKFGSLKKDVQRKKRSVATSHPPARAEATSAQAAARPPKDDEEAQGKTANAEKMNEAKPKEFDKAAFVKAVEDAIAAKAPKNLDEADKFADSGKPEEVKAEVQGKVGEGKTDSAEQIATTTAAPPDTSAAVTKEVVPMAADQPPRTPATPNPAQAVPDKLPPSATDMSAGPAKVDQQMSDAQVTEAQLKKSNEPAFNNALKEKKTAEQHSEVTPGELRKNESAQLHESTAKAKKLGTAAMGAMGAKRVGIGRQVGAGKTGAKSKDEEKRAQVTAILQGVFDTMKTEVEAILSGLDAKVDKQFTDGEKKARDEFTAEHKQKMEEYKDERYSGAWGWARWLDDKFTGLPAEADKIFEDARAHYVTKMRQVISDVADTIGLELNKAKTRIAKGRTDLQAEVKKLPQDLQAIGKEAAAGFDDQFDQLTQSVDDKGTELVDTLATKYTETLKSVDEEIAAEKEKNKGLIAKAIDAVKAVINTILELKRLLLSILAKAAQAVLGILADPIGFLGNLVRAVGAGLKQFMANIGKHLQQGIMTWLLGRTAEAGLQLPSKFDARGVLTMLAGLLGLTPAAIWARITRRLPPKAAATAEKALPLAAQVKKQGVAGMWEDLKTRVGDLRKDLLDKVIKYVTPTIVIAGITWVLSLLNPASAFVRAVKLIIDIVKFVVTQARQIFDFVNAVLDAVIAIAKGSGGGVPSLIERALARAIPVLLGFLAALLGLGGIAAKVKQIIQAMSKPVGRAIDWVIDKIVGLLKKLLPKSKTKPDKKKPTLPKKKRPDKPRRPKKPKRKDDRPRKPKPDKKSGSQKQRLEKAVAAALSAVNRFSGRRIAAALIKPMLLAIRLRYRLTVLEPVRQGDFWAIHGEINPKLTKAAKAKVQTKQPPKVSVGDTVEVKWGRAWAISEITSVTTETFSYLGHIHSGPVSGTIRVDSYDARWREYKPGRVYKVGKAFEAIKDLSIWPIYADASQVLSYRAHGKFNVPPGKNWHHIHEASAGGPNSVDNLALVGARINQVDFRTWFGRPQRGTGRQPLRQFLKGQGEQAHIDWGMRCIRAHGLDVVLRNHGRGPYQEIV